MFIYLQTRLDTTAARAEAKNAFTRYNDIRKQNRLKPIAPDTLPTLSLTGTMKVSERQKTTNEFIATLAKISGPHSGTLEETRSAWLNRETLAANVELNAVNHTLPSPATRLKEWLASSGLIFLAGIALIICGAVLTRRTLKNNQQATKVRMVDLSISKASRICFTTSIRGLVT